MTVRIAGRRAPRSDRQLIQNATHVLCNVLTVCRWRLELLDDEPPDRSDAITAVREELERSERILGDLGILLEAGEPDFLHRERIDLEHLGHELVAEVSGLGVREWRLDRAEGSMLGDGDLLREAVRKLADNAVRNTDEDDVVAIAACVVGDEARVWVRDTGRGLAPGDDVEIPLPQARGVVAHGDRRGAGLGLAIVVAIAEAHGGRLELESRVGEGSTFTIVLPRGAIAADRG